MLEIYQSSAAMEGVTTGETDTLTKIDGKLGG